MCPEGIAPCKTFAGTAFGAVWMGTTEEPWTFSGILGAGAESVTICRDTATCLLHYCNTYREIIKQAFILSAFHL